MELIKMGAEAVLYRDGERVIKERIAKRYRIPELDHIIRKRRTKREVKLLNFLRSNGINTPKVFEADEYRIVMEYVEGEVLKYYVEKHPDVMEDIGKIVGNIHHLGVIHGDLTTSNFIVRGDGIYVIDLGLGFFSRSVEDRAVDLLSFRRSYFATHPHLAKAWELFLEGYKDAMEGWEDIFKRMEEVAKRARYL